MPELEETMLTSWLSTPDGWERYQFCVSGYCPDPAKWFFFVVPESRWALFHYPQPGEA